MPIYAYKCDSCGFAKDVLQKHSDAPLSDCPSCGAPTFKKQVTAAGFQLKGSGWYATDFKGGGSAPQPSGDKPSEGGDSKADAKPANSSDATKPDTSASKKPDTAASKKSDAAPPASSA